MQKAIFVSRALWAGLLASFPVYGSAEGLTNAIPTDDNQNSGSYQYHVPERTSDGWDTADLRRMGLDAALITEFFNRLNAHFCTNMHSVLLVRSNMLVVEEYFAGTEEDGQQRTFNRETLHTVQSVTKSVTSLLIGIAVDRHLIQSADERISTFFPEFTDKADIRLKHFLSMTAGLAWDEETPYADPRNDWYRMHHTNDPVRFVLSRPVVAAPGARFVYSSGWSVTLGEVIRKVSGLRADKFAERFLFEPLGISNYSWWAFPNGALETGGGLCLRPRDMAKIGSLVLNNGRWQGKQIVSENWIKESTRKQAPDPGPAEGYGYQWWQFSWRVRDQRITAVQARGNGNQTILIFPALDLLVVVTGWDKGNAVPFIKLMGQTILPSAL